PCATRGNSRTPELIPTEDDRSRHSRAIPLIVVLLWWEFAEGVVPRRVAAVRRGATPVPTGRIRARRPLRFRPQPSLSWVPCRGGEQDLLCKSEWRDRARRTGFRRAELSPLVSAPRRTGGPFGPSGCPPPRAASQRHRACSTSGRPSKRMTTPRRAI